MSLTDLFITAKGKEFIQTQLFTLKKNNIWSRLNLVKVKVISIHKWLMIFTANDYCD